MSGEPESFLFSCNHEVVLLVCCLIYIYNWKREALWLRASRDVICYVAFPVLLSHSRQCSPEYSGARETALIDLEYWAGEKQ